MKLLLLFMIWIHVGFSFHPEELLGKGLLLSMFVSAHVLSKVRPEHLYVLFKHTLRWR